MVANNRQKNGNRMIVNGFLSSINFDDPTPEETEQQRDLLEGRPKEELYEKQEEDIRVLEYSEYERFNRAMDYLVSAKHVKTVQDKVRWLEDLGFYGVDIRGHPKTLPFSDVLRLGHDRRINAMFYREKTGMKVIVDETRKYLERSGFFKRSQN